MARECIRPIFLVDLSSRLYLEAASYPFLFQFHFVLKTFFYKILWFTGASKLGTLPLKILTYIRFPEFPIVFNELTSLIRSMPRVSVSF